MTHCSRASPNYTGLRVHIHERRPCPRIAAAIAKGPCQAVASEDQRGPARPCPGGPPRRRTTAACKTPSPGTSTTEQSFTRGPLVKSFSYICSGLPGVGVISVSIWMKVSPATFSSFLLSESKALKETSARVLHRMSGDRVLTTTPSVPRTQISVLDIKFRQKTQPLSQAIVPASKMKETFSQKVSPW